MHFALSEKSWILEEIGAVEFQLLSDIPKAADPGDSESAQDRLFPPPIRNPGSDEAEFLREWNAYVTDDLITQFSQDLATLSSDLRRAEVVGEDEDGDPIRRLEVPVSHAQQWFSSLNQARLVMGDVHDLYDDDGSVRPRENEAFSDFHHRWRVYDRSNFYAIIQEWLISRILDQ